MDTSALWIIVTFSVYLLLLIVVGWLGERRHGGSYAGFVSAGKTMGPLTTAISAAASSESAWALLGLSGLGYAKGAAGYWAAGGTVLGFLTSGLLLARRIKRRSEVTGALTFTDMLAARTGESSAVRILATVIIAFFLEIYVVSQFAGAGKQMASMQLMSYEMGVLVGAVIIGIYVLLGGYAAVCWTDTIQGLLMALMMLIFPVVAVVMAGPGAIADNLATTDGGLWIGGEVLAWSAIGFAVGQLAIGLGHFGMPHYLVRFITVGSERQAQRAVWIAVGWSSVVLFGAVTLGIAGRVLLPGLKDPEHILGVFTGTYFHPVIAGVVLAAVTAAIMSTADSQLMLAATAIINNLHIRLTGREIEDRRKVRLSRLVIAVLTTIALVLALRDIPVIYTMVLLAWGALGAAFGPPVILGLYWPRFNRAGALASMIVGPTVVIVWKLGGLSPILYELVPGFVVSMIAAISASYLTHADTG